MVDRELINVYFKWDSDADVWTAVCDELGLVLESGSYDALIERVKNAIPELIKENHLSKITAFVICTENRQVLCV